MELTEHHPALTAIAKALLAVHEVLLKELNGFETQVRKLAKGDARTRLLMTAPGVGPIVGLTYVAAIDDPGRFSSSKTVGAHFGMTPKKYQSGELTALNADLRRLRRWPSASVDRRSARRFARFRPGWRNAVQPNRETVLSQLRRERRSTRRFRAG